MLLRLSSLVTAMNDAKKSYVKISLRHFLEESFSGISEIRGSPPILFHTDENNGHIIF